MYVIETRIKGKRIQIGAYAKSRVYVRISSYSSAYKMSEEDFGPFAVWCGWVCQVVTVLRSSLPQVR